MRPFEERPPWGYVRLVAQRLPTVASALDLDTGGGEVLATMPTIPPRMCATEAWPPNAERARALLGPRGVKVVPVGEDDPLPFSDIGAVVFVLRKCVWWVPDFSVGRYRTQLRDVNALIRRDGSFVAHSSRYLIEAQR